jgi:coenzyme F420 hydrogenase subunit beta
VVVDAGLCCGCGACVGVCSTRALSIDIFQSHEPRIDESKCTCCGLCYEVCPGRGYPIVEWALGSCDDATRMVPERGPVRHYWLGHSTDPNIRLNSASGGIATSLLLYLLEADQVDDVVVIGMENERPMMQLTHDPQVVRDAMMSKYGPVPMLATMIPELRERPRRIAMTVTPCQLGGWRRATERIPKLRESSVVTLGLFCGHIQSYDALTSIAATLGIRYPGEAQFVAWRHGPHPGSARFERPDGTAAEKSLRQSYDIAIPHFSLKRCFLCPESGNWLADMTLGDIFQGGTDETVIICRTRQGHAALESARKAGRIVLAELPPAKVEACVIKSITRSKLLPAVARNAWLKKRGRIVPQFDYDTSALLLGKLRAMAPIWIWQYRLTFWIRTGWRRRFLLRHPALMEKTGYFLYRFPATIPGFRLGVKAAKLFARIFAPTTETRSGSKSRCTIPR